MTNTTESQRGGVGEWVLVPREATRKMRDAALRAIDGITDDLGGDLPHAVYKAMIAASPVADRLERIDAERRTTAEHRHVRMVQITDELRAKLAACERLAAETARRGVL